MSAQVAEVARKAKVTDELELKCLEARLTADPEARDDLAEGGAVTSLVRQCERVVDIAATFGDDGPCVAAALGGVPEQQTQEFISRLLNPANGKPEDLAVGRLLEACTS